MQDFSSKSPSPFKILYRLWLHLPQTRRVQLLLLLILMLISGFAELISLASIIPFLAAISDRERLWNNVVIQNIAIRLNLTQPSELIVLVAIALVICANFSALIRILNIKYIGVYTALIGSEFSCEAYRKTLHRDYTTQISINSSKTITTINSQSNLTVSALNASLQAIISLTISLFILIGFVLIDVRLALVLFSIFGTIYFLVASFSQREIKSNSNLITLAAREKLKILNKGYGAIRDVLMGNYQELYCYRYKFEDYPLRKLQAKNAFIGAYPRYMIEALGISAIAFTAILLNNSNSFGPTLLPTLGAFALGAQRLLPSLQQTYANWISLKSCIPACLDILEILDQSILDVGSNLDPLIWNRDIQLCNVSYRFNSDDNDVLSDLNLKIQAGESIGIIGSTGSGKSTLVDLIMGLLTPSTGSVSVDGMNIHDSSRRSLLNSWQSSISHVPQSIYLSDSTIINNIAFGVPQKDIIMHRVYEAANKAQIDGYIESLPNGYSTVIGERGVKLSGGQRQRLGIARALYRQSSTLILDEATSALDNVTERKLLSSLESLDKKVTIISIAHRLNTLRFCDRIVILDKGRIVDICLPSDIIND